MSEPDVAPEDRSFRSIWVIRSGAFLAIVAYGVNRGIAFDHWMPAIGGIETAMFAGVVLLATLEIGWNPARGTDTRWFGVCAILRAIVWSIGLTIVGSLAACATIEFRIHAAQRVGDRFLAQAQAFYDAHGRWPATLAELGIADRECRVGSFRVDYVVDVDEPIVQFELRDVDNEWHLLPRWLVSTAAVRRMSRTEWAYRIVD